MSNVMAMIMQVFQTFWWIFPLIAVLIFMAFTMSSRKVEDRVEYHRRGHTQSKHRCVIKGTNITFKPNKGKNAPNLTIGMEGEPETTVLGGKTYRIYHVAEGGGRSFSFIADIDEQLLKSVTELEPLSTKKDDCSPADMASAMTAINRVRNAIMPKVVDPEEYMTLTKPSLMAASASMSYFGQFTQNLIEHLPKGRMELAMVFVYILIGLAMGFAWGSLIVKMGIF